MIASDQGNSSYGVVKEGLPEDVPENPESQPSENPRELPGRGNIKDVSKVAASWAHTGQWDWIWASRGNGKNEVREVGRSM